LWHVTCNIAISSETGGADTHEPALYPSKNTLFSFTECRVFQSGLRLRERKKRMPLLGFEVLTAVIMKKSVCWDITSYIPLKVKRRFGGTYRIHFQGRRMSQAKNEPENSAFRLLS
jgi:hypothetical protein